ncbi:aspartic proteinase asp1 [Phtheirospermum japonicum]|uniref:Aspartic proteinase asp1 n=1 Tax=Phtheirospermum japonicum TaxID=374723 RepID=A0A830CF89_9LAMI|nr:aspartic proteinase asp1 [Phtheirospermum japonicum]
MEEETDEPPLTGIVIITLPPPHNPSFGKTITAFTFSSPSDHQTSQQSPTQQLHEPPPPPQIIAPAQSFSTFLHDTIPRTLVPILTISIIFAVSYFWVSVCRQTVFQLPDQLWNDNEIENDSHRKNKSEHRTFLFPLYRKPYGTVDTHFAGSNFEIKLGKALIMSSDDSKELDVAMINPKLMAAGSRVEIDAKSVMPVRGNIYPDGLYYTFMNFGNPPRPYFLDVDTGSDLTWIQCDAPCTSCAKGAHPFYKPVKANVLLPKDSYCVEMQRNQKNKPCDSCHQCDYEIEYADHSSSMGVLARDELYLNIANGSLAKSKVVFGCAYDQQGLLLNTLGKTDGILGLNRGKISFPSQLAKQGIINNVVGHCLSIDTSGGGYLFLGDDFVPHSQMVWVPMLQSHDSNSYQTEMVKMNYGRRQIGLGNAGSGRLVFDSGSSYSYFTEQAYNNLVSMLNDISSESLIRDMSDTSLPICWQIKSPSRSLKDVRHLFKSLNLQFGSKWWIMSKKLQIPPEGYLVTNSKGNVCLGILNGRKVMKIGEPFSVLNPKIM